LQQALASIVALSVLICLPTFAQNTMPLFPCVGKPTAKGCPAAPNAPTFNPIVMKDDYYDVYVESVCINQPDSWWHKKLVHVEVTLKTGKVSQTTEVYAQRTGSQCHIGVANFPLLTSIPANNHRLTLSAHIYRSDDQDGMQQILGFMAGEQKNTVLNTYAAASVPYLTAVSDIGTQVYKAFATHSQDFLDFKPMDLVPEGPVPTRFDLKDEYFVLYAGNQSLGDSDVYLDDSANLHLVADGSVVAAGSTWIVFRIQKREHRSDYPQRPWYSDWENLVRQVETRNIDDATVKKRITADETLLDADADYTDGDKNYYTDKFVQSEAEMLKYLDNPNASATDYGKAIDAALVTPEVMGFSSQGKLITAAGVVDLSGSRAPVVGQISLFNQVTTAQLPKVIVPDKFVHALKEVNAKY